MIKKVAKRKQEMSMVDYVSSLDIDVSEVEYEQHKNEQPSPYKNNRSELCSWSNQSPEISAPWSKPQLFKSFEILELKHQQLYQA